MTKINATTRLGAGKNSADLKAEWSRVQALSEGMLKAPVLAPGYKGPTLVSCDSNTNDKGKLILLFKNAGYQFSTSNSHIYSAISTEAGCRWLIIPTANVITLTAY